MKLANAIYFKVASRKRERESAGAKANQKQERQERRERQGGDNSRSAPSNAMSDALDLFELKQPYTLEQLKKRRKELMLRVHPDHGGSNMMARMVNEAFDLLKTRI